MLSVDHAKAIIKEINLCKENLEKILLIVQNDNISSFKLLESLNICYKQMAIFLYLISNLLKEGNKYSKKIESVSLLEKLIQSYLNNKPILLLNNNETISLNTEEDSFTSVILFYEKQLSDIEEYQTTINDMHYQNIISRVYQLKRDISKIIADKINYYGNIGNFDFDDEDYEVNIANHAILRAMISQNLNDCALLPSDITHEVINILGQGLNEYSTRDIGTLYYRALKYLESINLETIDIQKKTDYSLFRTK